VSKILAIFIVAGFPLLVTACTENKSNVSAPQNDRVPVKSVNYEPNSQADSGEGAVTEAIKNQTLPDFPSKSIGKALDGYAHFTAHEWKGTRTDSGNFYIDCIGWLDSKTMDLESLKSGVSRHGIALKFVVAHDSSFRLAMISRLAAKSDGSVVSYPAEDPKWLLEKIYSNKEIQF